jgi:hypothetical protein
MDGIKGVRPQATCMKDGTQDERYARSACKATKKPILWNTRKKF